MINDLPWSRNLRPEVSERWDELIQLKREFHKHAELSFKEHWTAQRIKDWLKANGLEGVKPVTETGVVALIEGGQPGPTIMYRADIDALPIQEDSGVDYPSENDGVMHACGHDAHTAIALMVASLVNQRRQNLKGNLKVVFQPAEEVVGGAQPMIDAGVMENPHVDTTFGLHVAANIPVGVFGINPGPTMAGAGFFRLNIIGKGGHAAWPHTTVDPILTAAHVVTALQSIVSRNSPPEQPAVVTVGMIHGGTKNNIIPDAVELQGTFRAFDADLMKQIATRIEEVTLGVTNAMGATYEADIQINAPPVVNDIEFTRKVQEHAKALAGADSIVERMRSSSDDMALFLEKAPGCYYQLGAAVESSEAHTHHQPRFAIDDRALTLGLELSLRVIDDYLNV